MHALPIDRSRAAGTAYRAMTAFIIHPEDVRRIIRQDDFLIELKH